ncbi:hypothetical protein BpHYR1_050204 [Brachionus plicatilis]|uniref:Uncharacterized protein n=1 Tax=Brachionus plicatilis TaxID=10195 RepID=A0A3M7SFW6_BRAPC|nr:hypothetical protein BpHYR1_050204 [Brachionus plicatilis]
MNLFFDTKLLFYMVLTIICVILRKIAAKNDNFLAEIELTIVFNQLCINKLKIVINLSHCIFYAKKFKKIFQPKILKISSFLFDLNLKRDAKNHVFQLICPIFFSWSMLLFFKLNGLVRTSLVLPGRTDKILTFFSLPASKLPLNILRNSSMLAISA